MVQFAHRANHLDDEPPAPNRVSPASWPKVSMLMLESPSASGLCFQIRKTDKHLPQKSSVLLVNADGAFDHDRRPIMTHKGARLCCRC